MIVLNERGDGGSVSFMRKRIAKPASGTDYCSVCGVKICCPMWNQTRQSRPVCRRTWVILIFTMDVVSKVMHNMMMMKTK